jgi:hypothetical protein
MRSIPPCMSPAMIPAVLLSAGTAGGAACSRLEFGGGASAALNFSEPFRAPHLTPFAVNGTLWVLAQAEVAVSKLHLPDRPTS